MLAAVFLASLIRPMPLRAATLPAKVLEIQARDVAWDATRSRFFVSVDGYDPIDPGRPSSIVMVNPETGQVEDSIPVMDTPDRLAVSDDGKYLYVSITAKGIVRRYNLPDLSPDLDIPLAAVGLAGESAVALTIATLPGKPQSIIVGRWYSSGRRNPDGGVGYADVAVYDGSFPRPQVALLSGNPVYDVSVYARPSNGVVYAYDSQRIYTLALSASGLIVSRSDYGFLDTAGQVSWSGGFASDPYGYLFDLDAGIVTGRVPYQESQNSACIPDVPNRSIYCVETVLGPFAETLGTLTQFSSKDLHATSSAQLDSRLAFTIRLWFGYLRLWGTNGILYFGSDRPDRTGRGILVFANSSDLNPVDAAPIASPVIDTTGVIHVPIPAGGILYDSQRNVVWASVTGQGGSIANNVVAIDPATGLLGASIYTGSEPTALAISNDGQRLFAALAASPVVVPLNLASLSQEATIRMIEAPSQNELVRKYWFATSLATIPGDSDRVVALRTGSPGTGSRDRSVAVFDRSGVRPQKFEEQFGGGLAEVDQLEHGDAPDALFAYDTTQFSTDRKLVRLSVGVDGVTLDRRLNAVNTDFGAQLVRIVYSDRHLYSSDGTVWTADAEQQTGTFALPGMGFPVVFPELNIVIYVSLSRNLIVAFDLASFRPVSFLHISSWQPFSAVRADKNALAIGTAGEVLIVPLSLFQGMAPFTITNRGGASTATAGTGSATVVGYGRIRPSAGATTPSGMAIFGFRQAGVLVTEAAVPASVLLQSGRIYAEVNGPVDTGVAIANPNSQTATIMFNFTDANGQNFGFGSTTIPSNGQIAAFLDQAPFNSGSSVLGTFSFSSSVPISVVALRGFTNERSEFLITTLPVSDLSASIPVGQSIIFPHFADGGGWTTQVALVNVTDSTVTGTVQFLTSSGSVATVGIDGQSTDSFSYSIAPRSSRQMQTFGSGSAAQIGSIRITPASSSATPAGLAIFRYKPGGFTVSEAGVPALRTGNAFRVYVEASGNSDAAHVGSIQSGIAVANSLSTPTAVTFDLTRLDGSSTGLTGSVNVGANGQVALFMNQIPGFSSLGNPQTPFQGLLRVSSLSSPIALVGLRERYNERGDFLITTTTPVDESAVPPTTELFFPDLADSGGYTTQFILFSGAVGQSTSGTLQLFSQSGQSLNVSLK